MGEQKSTVMGEKSSTVLYCDVAVFEASPIRIRQKYLKSSKEKSLQNTGTVQSKICGWYMMVSQPVPENIMALLLMYRVYQF